MLGCANKKMSTNNCTQEVQFLQDRLDEAIWAYWVVLALLVIFGIAAIISDCLSKKEKAKLKARLQAFERQRKKEADKEESKQVEQLLHELDTTSDDPELSVQLASLEQKDNEVVGPQQ